MLFLRNFMWFDPNSLSGSNDGAGEDQETNPEDEGLDSGADMDSSANQDDDGATVQMSQAAFNKLVASRASRAKNQVLKGVGFNTFEELKTFVDQARKDLDSLEATQTLVATLTAQLRMQELTDRVRQHVGEEEGKFNIHPQAISDVVAALGEKVSPEEDGTWNADAIVGALKTIIADKPYFIVQAPVNPVQTPKSPKKPSPNGVVPSTPNHFTKL